jgi:hypothetical protein
MRRGWAAWPMEILMLSELETLEKDDEGTDEKVLELSRAIIEDSEQGHVAAAS